jgi:hypothetical protein
MSRRDWQPCHQEILEASGRITVYTEGMTWASFRTDQKTVDTVVRAPGERGLPMHHDNALMRAEEDPEQIRLL